MPNIFWLNVNKASGIPADGNEQLITTRDQRGFIRSIRDATELSISSSTKPRSIPHPWAKVYLTCEYVLMDVKEDYHKLNETKQQLYHRIIGAWRGFLAMLALREVYDLDIQFKQLAECDGIGKSITNNRPFVAPKEKLSPLMQDNHPEYLIYVQGQPAGVTYPSIMALPGYCPPIRNEVPWAKEDEFVNPVDALTRGERMIVYAWVSHAVDFYQQHRNKPFILMALKDYLNDLDLNDSDTVSAIHASTAYKNANSTVDTLYAPLEEVIALNLTEDSEVRIDRSDILLIERAENIRPGYEKLVMGMLDELMYQRKPKLFSRFLPKDSRITAIKTEDIFLEKSYRFESTQINNTALEISASTTAINALHKSGTPQVLHIFPMKTEMALLLTPYFAENPKLEATGSSIKAVCAFNINNKRKEFAWSYAKEQRVELKSDRLGSTIIWPNIDRCSQYIVATSWNASWGERDGFVFIPLSDQITDVKKRRHRYLSTAYPAYLKGVWNSANASELIDIGIIKTKDPVVTLSGDTSANYALDFGTSATIAAYNLGNSIDTKKVDFLNQVNLIAANDFQARSANRLLFGCHTISAPYPTIYHAHPRPTTAIFEGGHPFFGLPNKRIEIKNNLMTNIKFDLGRGAGSAQVQKDYIRGLVHMLLIHARQVGVSSVNLNLSYPISIEDVAAFRENIREIISEYNRSQDQPDQSQNKKASDYPYQVTLNEKTLKFISESEAATRYFFVRNEKQESITLDIGGGSADLFAYNGTDGGKALIASVVAGSRVFLLNLLYRHPEIIVEAMDAIAKKMEGEPIEEAWFKPETYIGKATADEFYTELELLFQV